MSQKKGHFKREQKKEIQKGNGLFTGNVGDDERDEDGIGQNQSESEGYLRVSEQFGCRSRRSRRGFRMQRRSRRHGYFLCRCSQSQYQRVDGVAEVVRIV